MAKEIRWSQESVDTFNKIIEYLEKNWSQRGIENFINATEITLRFITESPKMFRKTSKKNVHEALITPHNLMIYKIIGERIDIITFWDTRKNPGKKKHK